jgi:predicted MFS family arabinose efflux permease
MPARPAPHEPNGLAQPSLAWRIVFAGTLALSMGIGPFAVNAVSALSPTIVPDLGLTRTELGSLATITFLVAAVATSLAGILVDRIEARRMLLGVFGFGGAAAAAMAGAQGLQWLWLGAVLGGLSQAIANPMTNQLIVDRVPRGTQGTMVGVKQSGVQMVQALIGLTLPALALVVTWRGSLLVGVGLMVLGLVAVLTWVPRGDAHGSQRTAGPKAKVGAGVWWLSAYTLTIGMTVQAVIVYSPLYAFERVGVSAALAGLATGVIGVVGMVARIAWSRVAEQRAAPVNTLTLLAALAACGALLVLLGEHVGAWSLWLGLALFAASALAVNAVAMLTVVRGAAGGSTGRATGVVGLGLYLGFTAGPVTFGALVDRTDSYTVGWAVVIGLCLLALVLTRAWRRHTG